MERAETEESVTFLNHFFKCSFIYQLFLILDHPGPHVSITDIGFVLVNCLLVVLLIFTDCHLGGDTVIHPKY